MNGNASYYRTTSRQVDGKAPFSVPRATLWEPVHNSNIYQQITFFPHDIRTKKARPPIRGGEARVATRHVHHIKLHNCRAQHIT
ncbi:unnamed protein product [Ectocarpus sp. 6 AP-2014]